MKEGTLRRVKLLAERVRKYKDFPEKIGPEERQELSLMFASTFKDFVDFLEIGMQFLGFSATPLQKDIARFIADEPNRNRMVQAGRGEAKSTITALYAVWRLIQDPCCRVMVVSGAEDQASDVATLIIRLIEQWFLLCWLKGDPYHGDRTSYKHYDVHYALRRVDKSASVSCNGITASLQGARADVLIADDCETQKNSTTQVMRDSILLRTKEFAAIVADAGGDIIYLGTPQTRESIYRGLQARGYTVRIWPSRYPEPDRLDHYAPDTLAPFILNNLALDPSLGTGAGIGGARGKSTDPDRYSEEELVRKELDYGPEGFDLQFMLDTTLSDEARTKIKMADFIVASCSYDEAPETYWYSAEPKLLVKDPEVATPATTGHRIYYAANASDHFIKYASKIMTIDPAGNGGDEVAYCVGGECNGYIHLFTVGGLKGGVTPANVNTLLDLALEFGVEKIWIESNMGHGTVENLFIQTMMNRSNQNKEKQFDSIGVEGYYNSIQKEKRIIDSIRPVANKHRLVVHERFFKDDWNSCLKYTPDKRMVVSALYQMQNITYDRNSLSHDDRADAIAALVAKLSELIALDEEKLAKDREGEELREFLRNPMGYDHKPTKKFNPFSRFYGMKGYR